MPRKEHGNSKKLTPDERQAIIDAWAQGNMHYVKKQTGHGGSVINKVIKEEGIQKKTGRPRKVTDASGKRVTSSCTCHQPTGHLPNCAVNNR